MLHREHAPEANLVSKRQRMVTRVTGPPQSEQVTRSVQIDFPQALHVSSSAFARNLANSPVVTTIATLLPQSAHSLFHRNTFASQDERGGQAEVVMDGWWESLDPRLNPPCE